MVAVSSSMKKNSSRIIMIKITKKPFPPPQNPLDIVYYPLNVLIEDGFSGVASTFKYRPPFYFQYMEFGCKVLPGQ